METLLFVVLGVGIFAAASADSLTGGNHSPISITSNKDFTLVGATAGCQCVAFGSGTASDPYVIGPWTIMATSSSPGIFIQGVAKFFTLTHITVHGTNQTDGIDIFNVNALGTNGQPLDSVLAVNLDSTSNGIFIKNSSGVLVDGNSVNNSMNWGLRVENSHDNTITFMTFAHNGLNTPDTKAGDPASIPVFLQQHFAGGVLFLNSNHNTLSVSQLSEDAYAGFVLVNSNDNMVSDVHSRYPDYYGGVLQDSSHNTIVRISMQTADFVGLVVRGGGFNTITNSTFSANGPIGNEIFGRIVPYYISGLYLGWGTHDNGITLNHSNNGNTGPSIVVDDGLVPNPVPSPTQTVNPFNNNAGNDPGIVPSSSAFDPSVPTAAGSGNTICGNSFPSSWPTNLNPNNHCPG